MDDEARRQAEHHRRMAAHFRSLLDLERADKLRHQLEQFAARHERVAAEFDSPRSEG